MIGAVLGRTMRGAYCTRARRAACHLAPLPSAHQRVDWASARACAKGHRDGMHGGDSDMRGSSHHAAQTSGVIAMCETGGQSRCRLQYEH